MEASGWITMILILAFVWGGFAVILVTALLKESRKDPYDESTTDG